MFNPIFNKYKKKANRQNDNIFHMDGYELYKYTDKNGKFDYELYKKIQVEANKKKIDHVWAQQENIIFLAKYLIQKKVDTKFGLCHGTRQGFEQKWFAEVLGCKVLGTDISDTATKFENTIKWDFQEIKNEWVNKVDFIYSNSFDHSYDPKKCLNNWMRCLKKDGVCIIEHSTGHVNAKKTDPLGIKLSLFPYVLLKWSEGKFSVREVLKEPQKTMKNFDVYFFIIKNNN